MSVVVRRVSGALLFRAAALAAFGLSGVARAQVVTFQNFTEAKVGTNLTAITLSTPPGTVSGDLLIACVVTDGNNAATLNPPAGQGWTQIARSVQGTAVTLGVWWKLAGASEPGTHQWNWSAAEQSYGWMMRFTGHSPTAPINAAIETGGNASAPASPSVSPTVTETMILRIGGFDNGEITVDSPGLATNGPHTAITMDRSSTSTGNNTSGGAGYRIQSASGASGSSSFALLSSQDYRTVTIAIAPFRCVSAGECDDANVCTTDSCASGFCQHVNNSNSCSDGNPCTVTDVCSGGVCVPGSPPNCSGAGNPCNTASCNPSGPTGNCNTLTPVANGTPCSDGLFCTDGDSCVSGSCFAGPARDCSAAGNQCNTGACNESLDQCVAQPANQGLPCNDGNNCTLSETCQSGVCTGGVPPDCTGANNQCNVASCDPNGALGNCNILTPRTNGTPCNDGQFCTATDACQSGACVGSGDPCAGLICDEAFDACFECAVHTDCDDGVPCTVDFCSGGSCVYTPNNALCNDGLYCNGAETCSATLGCQPGTPPCTDGVACTTDSCIEASDTCSYTPVDAMCDDGLFCNGPETCHPTFGCQPGGDPCNDGIGCTTDSCVEGTDTCVHTPNDGSCDDGLFCNGAETCSATLGCQPGSDPCGDAIPCTTDACQESTDSCTHTPNPALCDDGAFCNGSEVCSATLGCQAGADPCDDGVACTIDACSEATDTCTHTPDDLACDDGAFCTGTEVCDPVLGCVPGTDPCAPALVCDEAGDVCRQCLAPADCDDGDACTIDTCVSGSCSHARTAEIVVDLEIEGLGAAVTRDVAFEITSCGAAVESRVLPITFSSSGAASLTLSAVDASADWIAVREGHTLRRRAALSFASCSAAVGLTGGTRLASGDFSAGAIGQDNLVDITDFSILASRWNQAIDPNLGAGADATGDGVQSTADFTAIQTNFLRRGDAPDGCATAYSAGTSRGRGSDMEDRDGQRVRDVSVRVPVRLLRLPDAARADLNGDGFVDPTDIRAFAQRNRIRLSPEFDRLLKSVERPPIK